LRQREDAVVVGVAVGGVGSVRPRNISVDGDAGADVLRLGGERRERKRAGERNPTETEAEKT